MISFSKHDSGDIGDSEHDSVDIENILGDDGLIAQAYGPFEIRDEQIRMASAVQQAFRDGYHLAVEAGTGVGKSFAYLVNAIELARQKKGRILISTYTITLQEQLINKDIPFLAAIMPVKFTACLAKGRGNYVCRRRLEYAVRKQKNLFDNAADELIRLNIWAGKTEDGSLSDLPFVPSPAVWDAVASEHGNCRGRKCPHFCECFYWRSRRKLETADIIVANHALLFSDLVLKEQHTGILPDYNFVVIDEAHNIEHVAEGHFGIDISNFTFSYMLNRLYNPRTRKGLLAYGDTQDARDLVSQCRDAVKIFFIQVQAWYEHAKNETNGKCHPAFVDDNITGPVKDLRLGLAALAKEGQDDDETFEFSRYIDRCRALETDIRNMLTQPDAAHVYWVEAGRSRRAKTSLRSAPLDVGPDIKRCLFDNFKSVITTSATLSCDGGKDDKAGFTFFAGRIGMEEYEALKLGSPFDYRRQVTLYIEGNLPEPNSADFQEQAAEAIKKYLLKTGGKAFVLFTSYSMLKNMADILGDWLAENTMELLCQGAGVDRSALLEQFKSDESSVLFGTDSFWQGVDVPGEALSNVIILRLPFAVPNHPLVQGRIEQIRSRGENPFVNYQLPTAIIKFKQGFGRLIRNKTDTGIVVVLDSRIVRKSYGKQFLAAIPDCRVEIVSESW